MIKLGEGWEENSVDKVYMQVDEGW